MINKEISFQLINGAIGMALLYIGLFIGTAITVISFIDNNYLGIFAGLFIFCMGIYQATKLMFKIK